MTLKTERLIPRPRDERDAMPRQSVIDMPPIEGRPELTWPGKRPLRSATWRPSLLRESYGSANDGWMNKLYYGDNLQVMAHLLKDFRGKVDLVYIDPPFGSNANYGSLIHPKGRPVYPLLFTFGETRFGDVWKRDEYLQFMYERLILIRELLSEKGSLFVHCDRCSQHLLRCLLDEVFGADVEKEGAPGLVNEIVWHHSYTPVDPNDRFAPSHDTIFWYSKTGSHYFNAADVTGPDPEGAGDERGKAPGTVWRMDPVAIRSGLAFGYPTQKPEALLERIVLAASVPGSIVMDCFMGSGTTGAVAMRTGRRFLGADINPASLHTTTKRLVQIARSLECMPSSNALFTGFEVHSVPSDQEAPKPEGDVDVAMADGRLVICGFRPENLVRKLCVGHDFFEDWRHLADSVFVDWNYDGEVFRPSVADVPAGDDLVEGSYPTPEDAGAIRIRVVDVLSEAYEVVRGADWAGKGHRCL